MATIIFEQVFVSQSLDSDGNKLDIYRYWKSDYGSLGRFRATETIGYGDHISYSSYSFLATGPMADKLKKMNLKAGSSLYVVGEYVPEVFEGQSGKTSRQVVKILDARFTMSRNQRNEAKGEKQKTENSVKPQETPKVRIPVPNMPETQTATKKESAPTLPKVEIPKPTVAACQTDTVEGDDEVLNLDIQDLFSESSGFMGLKNPSA